MYILAFIAVNLYSLCVYYGVYWVSDSDSYDIGQTIYNNVNVIE
jgi:hypothetical protein